MPSSEEYVKRGERTLATTIGLSRHIGEGNCSIHNEQSGETTGLDERLETLTLELVNGDRQWCYFCDEMSRTLTIGAYPSL